MKHSETNTLFPVFLKLNELSVLIIGGGGVALEKLNAILNNSPDAKITLLAREINTNIRELSQQHNNIALIQDSYSVSYLAKNTIIISAVNDKNLSAEIANDAKTHGVLHNAADKPDLCDFYLGSVVQKGHLKIAISTNGKSPTMAKRIKELFERYFPEEITINLERLYEIRSDLQGNIKEKIKVLNEITKDFPSKANGKPKKVSTFKWKKITAYLFGILGIMLAGHLLFSLIPLQDIWSVTSNKLQSLDQTFFYFILGGFIAQMIDGALGMAYGVSATTYLLSFGISPAVASMSVHASEIFTSGVSGFMHLKFGNVHNKLFKTIVIPGVLGSILGAYILSEFENYNAYIKPIVGVYTLLLGCIILYKVLRKNNKRKKVKRAGWLASLGGFLDAIGGGGWGPVVSSTLIASGKNPRMVIGSVNLAEFFVSLASSFTFFALLGSSIWQPTLGLIIGGVLAAPIAAKLSQRVNTRIMMIMVGCIVIIVSLRIIILTFIK